MCCFQTKRVCCLCPESGDPILTSFVCMPLSDCVSVFHHFSVSVCLSVCLSVCRSVPPLLPPPDPAHLPACLFVRLFICLSVYPCLPALPAACRCLTAYAAQCFEFFFTGDSEDALKFLQQQQVKDSSLVSSVYLDDSDFRTYRSRLAAEHMHHRCFT